MSAEAKIQSAAVKYARSRGLLVKRNYMGPGAEVGWPDVEFYGPRARMLMIEFKAPGSMLRPMQEYRIKELRRLGHWVEVCDTYEAAKAMIDSLL